LTGLTIEDLDKRLVDLEIRHLHHDRFVGVGQRDHRIGGPLLRPLQPDVGDDLPVRAFDVDTLLDCGNVAGLQQRLQLIPQIHDQCAMHARPKPRILQIRVHSGKDHRHLGPSEGIRST
jgi:hypothetical protein